MARFRTQVKHLLIILVFGYFTSIWLLSHSNKKPSRHHVSSSKAARILPRDPDESLTRFIQKLPLKTRFEIERRHISYNLRLGQRDEFDSARCGSWPVHYLRTKQQLQHQQQRRSLVHWCGKGENCGGLSDRLMSVASLFTVSLLTDREFFVDWEGYPLHSVLRTPFLNLQAPSTLSQDTIEDDSQREHSQEEQQQQSPSTFSLSNWEAEDLDLVFGIRSMSTYLDTRARTRSGHQAARKYHDQLIETPQAKIQMNRGLIQRIMTDPSFGDRLESMGMHQHNAYECVLSFLFRPTLTTQELIHQYRAVFKTPGVTTIGIHIPSSLDDDDAGDRRPLALTEYEHSIPCAQNLSREIKFRTKNPKEQFLYVIFTDSDQVRNRIQQEHGHQLNLIFPPASQQNQQQKLRVGNNGLKKRGVVPASAFATDSTAPISAQDEDSTLLNSSLFSETDYQIITSSSFSKLALFRKGAMGRRSAILMPNKAEWSLYRESHHVYAGTEGAASQESPSPVLFEGIRLPDCSRMDDAITPWDKIASFGTLG
ncbi:hypothetical protein BGX23_003181 [Mortierella sp. AD031]|nr:hypothetical protein BGX23_003181 [Mortierella sp. AD031]